MLTSAHLPKQSKKRLTLIKRFKEAILPAKKNPQNIPVVQTDYKNLLQMLMHKPPNPYDLLLNPRSDNKLGFHQWFLWKRYLFSFPFADRRPVRIVPRLRAKPFLLTLHDGGHVLQFDEMVLHICGEFKSTSPEYKADS